MNDDLQALIEQERIHVTVVNGVKVVFITDDGHSHGWFYPRYANGAIHEPPLSKLLVDAVQPGHVFIDVGAHLGYFSCLAAAKGARVFAFEMQNGLVPIIERNAAANGFGQIYVLNAAAGDRVGLVSFPKAGLTPGKKGFDKPPCDGDTMVNTVTLDSLFAAGPTPDVMKIDVEGAEMQVLAGARQILADHHPTLFLELHCRHLPLFDASLEGIHDILSEADYGMRCIQHRNGEAPLGPPLDRDAFLALTGNPAVVCTRA